MTVVAAVVVVTVALVVVVTVTAVAVMVVAVVAAIVTAVVVAVTVRRRPLATSKSCRSTKPSMPNSLIATRTNQLVA